MKVTKFLIIGISNTLLANALYSVLVVLGTNYWMALLFAYIFGIFFGYFSNYYWTFAKNKSEFSFFKYIVLYIGVFFLNSAMLFLLVELFFLDPILSQFFIIGTISLISFSIQDNWIFNSKINPQEK